MGPSGRNKGKRASLAQDQGLLEARCLGPFSVETAAILAVAISYSLCLIIGGESFPYPIPFCLVQSFIDLQVL